MQSALDITKNQLALLKSVEIEEVCERVWHIVQALCRPAAAAVVLWDKDFENYSEDFRYCFGAKGEPLRDFVDAYCCESAEWESEAPQAFLVDTARFQEFCPPEVLPVFALKIETADEPVALILIAGDAEIRVQDIEEHFSHYALKEALSNAYEVAELRREVERLRQQYEQLEEDFQEQKKIAAALEGTGHTTFRMEQNDKEKLVYEISNAVRSSLEIHEVISTAVSKIGKAFMLSRCMVLWPMPDSDEYTIYEYHDETVPACKDLFFTPAGRDFVHLASTKTAPHDFFDESELEAFDKRFLRNFSFLSGMLVPLIYQDRNIGSLFLQDCNMPREWSIDNTALIGSLADLITVAIEHANMHEEKKRQAVTDGLTGISNRRHFTDTFQKEFERARRYGNSLSLVVVDLDFLKKINDTYGHQAGDEAIRSIGGVLSKSCRSVDTAARYGGEEFCLLLPDTELHEALQLAERIRARIQETHVEGPGNISASLGVATFPTHATDIEALFEAADHALYAAKEGGRNRVCSPASEDHK